MSSIKQHFFLILPLVALLFSLESILLVDRAVLVKEDKLLQNYSIIIASKQKLSLDFIAQNIPEALSIEPIDVGFVLNKIRVNMSSEDFENIKKELSLYYTLKLKTFPDEKRLNQIDSTLTKIPGIIKTESFAKTHNQTYKLLFLVKFSIQIFASLIGVLSVLLMIGQIRIWRFEHSKRVQIMGYLGASTWIKNKTLIKSVFNDAILATLITSIGFLYFSTTQTATQMIQTLEIQENIFYFLYDFGILFGVSIAVSLFSLFIAIVSQRKA